MNIFTCPVCGSLLKKEDIINAKGIIDCPTCDNKILLPKYNQNENVLSKLDIAKNYIYQGKFDDAYKVYREVVKLDSKEPEGYFGLALSSYKIQYLHDKVNNCLQPICYEFNNDLFSNDENYLKALECATDLQKKEYQNKAKAIDDIINRFKAYNDTLKPYDCFICVKVSDEDGGHTEDSVVASKIYDLLKNEGFNPFYSEKELKNLTGTDYEAMILYALYTSKCMYVVCGNKKYLRTIWVENEYSRYIETMKVGMKPENSLSLIYLENPIERIPSYDGTLNVLDYNDKNSAGEIVAFISRFASNKKMSDKEMKELAEKIRKQKEEKERLEKALAKQRALFEKFTQEATIEGDVLVEYLGNDSEVIIPEGIRIIGENAFFGNKNIEFVTLPNTVEEIQYQGFSHCSSLKKIKWSENLKIIQDESFFQTKLVTVELPNSVVKLGNGVFCGCDKLRELIIPSSVTEMGDSLAYDCINLRKLIIKAKVSVIKEYSFAKCCYLEKVELPKTLTKLESCAFLECRSLPEIELPDFITYIGDCCFHTNSSLKRVKLPSALSKTGKDIFGDCKRIERVYVVGWPFLKKLSFRKKFYKKIYYVEESHF